MAKFLPHSSPVVLAYSCGLIWGVTLLSMPVFAADKISIWIAPQSINNPKSGGRHLIQGLKYLDSDLVERAAAQFDFCTEPGLVSSPVLLRMGTAYLDNDNFQRGFACLDTIIKRDRKFVSDDDLIGAYTTKAHIFLSLKKNHEATECLVAACRVKPGHWNAPYHEASEELLRGGRASEALAISDEGIKAVPALPFAYLARALVLNSMKRSAEALETLNRCLTVCAVAKKNYGPDCYIGFIPKVYQERAICYDRLGQPAKAAADRKYVRSENNQWDDSFFGSRSAELIAPAPAPTKTK